MAGPPAAQGPPEQRRVGKPGSPEPSPPTRGQALEAAVWLLPRAGFSRGFSKGVTGPELPGGLGLSSLSPPGNP